MPISGGGGAQTAIGDYFNYDFALPNLITTTHENSYVQYWANGTLFFDSQDSDGGEASFFLIGLHSYTWDDGCY